MSSVVGILKLVRWLTTELQSTVFLFDRHFVLKIKAA